MTEYVNGNQTRTFEREIIIPATSHTILQLGIVCAMRCTGYIEERRPICVLLRVADHRK